MADVTAERPSLVQRFCDMLDGTFAKRVVASGGPLVAQNVLIANGTSISGVIDVGTARAARLYVPASWTAANLTFQVSPDGGTTWGDLYDNSGSEYTVVVSAGGRGILLPIADFLGIRHMKIRSGTGGTPVNQGADRTLILTAVQ